MSVVLYEWKKLAAIGGALGALYGIKKGDEEVVSHYSKVLSKYAPAAAASALKPKTDDISFKPNKGVLGIFSSDADEKLKKLKQASSYVAQKATQAQKWAEEHPADRGLIGNALHKARVALFGKSKEDIEAEKIRKLAKAAPKLQQLSTRLQNVDQDLNKARMYGAVNYGLAGAAVGGAIGAATSKKNQKPNVI